MELQQPEGWQLLGHHGAICASVVEGIPQWYNSIWTGERAQSWPGGYTTGTNICEMWKQSGARCNTKTGYFRELWGSSAQATVLSWSITDVVFVFDLDRSGSIIRRILSMSCMCIKTLIMCIRREWKQADHRTVGHFINSSKAAWTEPFDTQSPTRPLTTLPGQTSPGFTYFSRTWSTGVQQVPCLADLSCRTQLTCFFFCVGRSKNENPRCHLVKTWTPPTHCLHIFHPRLWVFLHRLSQRR